MLPTLVLSLVLATSTPPPPAPTAAPQAIALLEGQERAALEEAEDGFETDVSGFPERRGALEPLATRAPTGHSPLGLARSFLGAWLAASTLFGLVWGLLGWATRNRRMA